MPTASPKIDVEYEVTIGLEVHAQLLTESKMFCRCSTDYANAAPNTHNCPICMGFPGTLPVINEQAIDDTIMTALALNCHIAEYSKFDRKNYFYPDLPKGYQISQYDMPLSTNGYLMIRVNGEDRRIGITRIHLEEDTGRHLEREGRGEAYSLIDLNRAGVPLMEIVGEPDIRTPEEARLYMEKLRTILLYLGVNSGRMEEGALRCDANISVRPKGQKEFGAKVEIKNMNSFRAVERALAYEAERQEAELRAGHVIEQQTRGWREDKGVTVAQRSKEEANDYRYFPEPDLPRLVVSREWVERIRARLPELPDAKRQRLIAMYELSDYDADQLTAERALAEYFEAAVKARRRAWQGREVALDDDGWALVAERGHGPGADAETAELLRAVQDAIATVLTPHQRAVLVALTLRGVPIDVLAERLGTTRGALYKTLRDARRKLRAHLALQGLHPVEGDTL